jgi:hypothetical protein
VYNDWYLTVNNHFVGKNYRSLTHQLLFARWLVNDIFTELKVESDVAGKQWEPVEIRVMKSGEEQAKDVI